MSLWTMLTVGSSQDQAPASCLLVVIATKLKEPEEGFCEENEVRSEFDKGNICFVKKKEKKERIHGEYKLLAWAIFGVRTLILAFLDSSCI